jgi:Integrase core domain
VEWLHGQRFATLREAKDAVLEWMRWYNLVSYCPTSLCA